MTTFPQLEETFVRTWFERDRAHVALYDARDESLLLEFWDDECLQAVEDGFLDPRDFHGSAYAYLRHLAS